MAEQNKFARRSLFAGLGLAVAAGIAAKFAPKSVIPASAEPAPAEPEGDGYRLTEHIKKYYRTTHL
ncbi:hypothetical protein E4K72_01960 [Oxalobacteraceae bacterium OM1]|nr:hypothetical protein E4K72_01960 [Oxalobacteraceae bacterium OM1]